MLGLVCVGSLFWVGSPYRRVPGGCAGERRHSGKPHSFLTPSASAPAPVLVLTLKQGSHHTRQAFLITVIRSSNPGLTFTSACDNGFGFHYTRRLITPRTSVPLSSHIFKKKSQHIPQLPINNHHHHKEGWKAAESLYTMLGKHISAVPPTQKPQSEQELAAAAPQVGLRNTKAGVFFVKQNKLLSLCKVYSNQTLTHQLRHQQNFYFRHKTDVECASVSLELEILHI